MLLYFTIPMRENYLIRRIVYSNWCSIIAGQKPEKQTGSPITIMPPRSFFPLPHPFSASFWIA